MKAFPLPCATLGRKADFDMIAKEPINPMIPSTGRICSHA